MLSSASSCGVGTSLLLVAVVEEEEEEEEANGGDFSVVGGGRDHLEYEARAGRVAEGMEGIRETFSP